MVHFRQDIWKDIPFFKLYPILNSKEISKIPFLFSLGIKWIQIREKEENLEDYIDELKEMVDLAKSFNGKIIINDDVEIAKRINSKGLHLGQGDTPVEKARKILGKDSTIGLSCYTKKEILNGFMNPFVDYLAIGPVFPTPFKDKKPLGLEFLKDYLNKGKMIVAIGGIGKENIFKTLETGVDKVAFIRFLKDILKE